MSLTSIWQQLVNSNILKVMTFSGIIIDTLEGYGENKTQIAPKFHLLGLLIPLLGHDSRRGKKFPFIRAYDLVYISSRKIFLFLNQ